MAARDGGVFHRAGAAATLLHTPRHPQEPLPMLPIDPTREVSYIDLLDREGEKEDGQPKPGASVWHFGVPSIAQRQAIADGSYAMRMGEDGKGQMLSLQGSVAISRVRSSLRRVENFMTPWRAETCDVDPSRQVPTLAFLGTIPDAALQRMAARVAQLCNVSEEQVGKFGRQSGPPGTPAEDAAPAASAGA